MTYQKKLRKKGLQSRLNKKKRKEEIKKRKGQMTKQGQKHHGTLSGPAKLMRPVLNSEGLPVANKFDFADNETKKDGKKKTVSLNNEPSASFVGNPVKPDSFVKKKNLNNSFSVNHLTKPTGSENVRYSQNSSKINNNLNSSSDLFVETKFKKEKSVLDNSIQVQNITGNSSTQHGPLFNKENKLVFSKVYIPENKNKKFKKKIDKDPKKILEKLKENSKKISNLEKEDKEKAGMLKEKQKWAAALKRASGEKVKDDPELLKKSISREKHKKMRSQKKWQARIETVQKDKDERQKKRAENIQARRNENKKRKMKKAIKKGSFVQL